MYSICVKVYQIEKLWKYVIQPRDTVYSRSRTWSTVLTEAGSSLLLPSHNPLLHSGSTTSYTYNWDRNTTILHEKYDHCKTTSLIYNILPPLSLKQSDWFWVNTCNKCIFYTPFEILISLKKLHKHRKSMRFIYYTISNCGSMKYCNYLKRSISYIKRVKHKIH